MTRQPANSLASLSDDARFVPFDQATHLPHVVVDGPSSETTVLGLSHWPTGATPPSLSADTSTEIAARYVDADPHGDPVAVVTNNHFDEDGVLAAFVALEREPAGPLRELAEEAARAGDFFTWTRPEAAQVALALMAMAERRTTPFTEVLRALNRASGRDPAGEITIALLPHVRGLLAEPDRYRRLWQPAWDRVLTDVSLLETGDATITTLPDVDVALVTSSRPVDLLAICPRTDAMRILHATADGQLLLEHRYETWVRYVSRSLPARVDLNPIVPALAAATPNQGTWRFEGIEHPRGRLLFTDARGRPQASGLEPEHFIELVTAHAGSTV